MRSHRCIRWACVVSRVMPGVFDTKTFWDTTVLVHAHMKHCDNTLAENRSRLCRRGLCSTPKQTCKQKREPIMTYCPVQVLCGLPCVRGRVHLNVGPALICPAPPPPPNNLCTLNQKLFEGSPGIVIVLLLLLVVLVLVLVLVEVLVLVLVEVLVLVLSEQHACELVLSLNLHLSLHLS